MKKINLPHPMRAARACLIVCLAIFGLVTPLAAADRLEGIWLQQTDNGKPESVVYLYIYDGKMYGRMLAAFDTDGKLKETIAAPQNKAEKLKGDPWYMNLDYIYKMTDTGREWSGSIMDPRTAEEFDCKIWKEGKKLMVRGQLKGLFGFIGRNQVWVPLPEGTLPADVIIPDPATFVPVPLIKK